MKKKILALILAGTMVMGSCLTASATEISTATDGQYKADVEVTEDITTPTIKITVPTTAAVTLNPYQLKTTVGNNTGATTKVVSDSYFIKNESNVAIRVDGKLQVVPTATTSKVVLATGALTGKETTKTALIYLDVQSASSDSDKKTVAAFDKASTSQILGGKTAVTKNGLITLAEGDSTATYAHYTFGGDVVTTPAVPWSDDDTVDVSLTWVFTPVIPAP